MIRSDSRKGLSLVELLVSLFIAATLISLLMVAVQSTREAARKFTCFGNLRQVGLGVSNYVSVYNAFPPGGMENGFSTHVRILPYVDLDTIHDLIDYNSYQSAASNNLTLNTPGVYTCPSERVIEDHRGLNTQTSYVGVYAGGVQGRENGMLITVADRRFVKPSDVTDGLSNTLLFVETRSFSLSTEENIPGVSTRTRMFSMPRTYALPNDIDQFFADCNDMSVGTQNFLSLGGAWLDGSTGYTRMSCIYPNLPRNCLNLRSTVRALYTPSSVHPGAFTVALADGAVRRFSDSIDTEIWRGLGTRDGGEVVTLPE